MKSLKILLISLCFILIGCNDIQESQSPVEQANEDLELEEQEVQTEIVEVDNYPLNGEWIIVYTNGDRANLELKQIDDETVTGFIDGRTIEGWVDGNQVLLHSLDYLHEDYLTYTVSTWSLPETTLSKTISYLKNDSNIYSIYTFLFEENSSILIGQYQDWTIGGVHTDNGDYLTRGHKDPQKITITRNDGIAVENGDGKVLFDDGNIQYIGVSQKVNQMG